MKSLRILHVLGQRPEKTGSGIYIEKVISQAKNRGFTNHMLAALPEGYACCLKHLPGSSCSYVYFESDKLNFPVTGMSDVMPYRSSLFKDLKGERLDRYKTVFGQALQQAVSDFSPDIIHTNHLFVLTALARKLFPDIPMVSTCHGTDLRQYNNCEHLRGFVKRYCRQLNKVIALSDDQKSDISRIYEIPKEKILVAGGGYDETLFTRAPKSSPGTVHILYAGKLNRSKGVPWLLKSLMNIRGHDWHLHMAGSGSGPEYDDCMELAARLGDRVTHHGFVSHLRLSELMKQAHIQVLPSFFEGIPLALFEGLASGCRIIATKLSGYDEIFGKADPTTVRLIDLPPLETIDRPYQKDEARLETLLTEAVVEMMAEVRNAPDFTDPQADDIAGRYTWSRVFALIMSAYEDALK